MKEKVFDYIKRNPECTLQEVARNLSINEMEALEILEKLSEECKITRNVRPLGNDKDSDCSCFYCEQISISGEEYQPAEDY